ncbi:MAG TPA: hypothetical protein VJ840_05195 [Gemmatimonadaceae bacterium]|nr:hypothetical protein [Gemmatimonadaceae bacterium]
MKNTIRSSARHQERVFSPDDPTLLEFVSELRRSVKGMVLAERRRGVPLAQIVAHVQEMVRREEENTHPATPNSSLAFRAISKCAVAWCIDAYLPPMPHRSTDRFPLRLPS